VTPRSYPALGSGKEAAIAPVAARGRGYGRYQARPLRLTVAGDRSTIMTAVTEQEGNP
jgi:hypothetical protein